MILNENESKVFETIKIHFNQIDLQKYSISDEKNQN
jgi:hypothetical protein